MPQIRDNPMQSIILTGEQVESQRGRPDRVNRKLVGRDRLRKTVNRGILINEFARDDFVYIRGREEEFPGFKSVR